MYSVYMLIFKYVPIRTYFNYLTVYMSIKLPEPAENLQR